MAEVLGVVASGIAVTQGAQTVGQAALFLSRLWREVKDVPETIHNIVEELELAGKLVTAIEAELTNPVPSIGPDAGGPLTTIQCLTIQRCRQVHKDLENLVDDLAADIASSRKRKRLLAKAQVVLKKETLESYEKRLQKALRFLDSAVQLHLASSIKQQPRLIAAEVTNVWMSKTLLPPAEEAPPVSAKDTKEEKVSSKDDEPEVLGSPHARKTHQNEISLRGTRRDRSSTLLRLLGIEFEEQSEATGASKSTSYRIRISPPQWLAAKTWDLQVSMACSGWTARLSHYVTVPSDSEVFRVVGSGTREQLFRLFDEGLASPYSVNENGWTLLHHAMANRRDLVVPLAQLGIDFCYKSRATSLTPCDLYSCDLSYILGSPVHHRDSDQDWAIHRLMLSRGVYDDILSIAHFRNASDSLHGLVISQMTRSVELFDSFHTHVFPDLYQWPLEKRIENFRFNFSTSIPDAKAIARFFDPGGRVSPEHLRQRDRLARETVLEQFTHRYFREHNNACHGLRSPREWEEFRLLIRDMVAVVGTSGLTTPPSPGTMNDTLLVQGLLNWREHTSSFKEQDRRHSMGWWPWKYCVRNAVRSWVEDVGMAGHDLQAYGAAEMSVFGRSETAQCLDWPPRSTKGSSEGPWRWKGFKYGPRPEDWDLIWEWDPRVDEFVGDFWDWVENPPLCVPGAWVDDDEKSDDGYYYSGTWD